MNPDENHRGWAERSGAFSPEYYAQIGPNEVSEALVDALDYYASTDASILELGCSSGRHLAHLHEHGYDDLAGIDINDDSFDVMAEHYPHLADTGTFLTGAIEDILPDMPADAFDVVFSVETLQHVHPDDEAVFEAVASVASDLLITAENEGNSPQRGRDDTPVSCVHDDFPLYHRAWNEVFSRLGFAQVVREPTKRDTVRVFKAV